MSSLKTILCKRENYHEFIKTIWCTEESCSWTYSKQYDVQRKAFHQFIENNMMYIESFLWILKNNMVYIRSFYEPIKTVRTYDFCHEFIENNMIYKGKFFMNSFKTVSCTEGKCSWIHWKQYYVQMILFMGSLKEIWCPEESFFEYIKNNMYIILFSMNSCFFYVHHTFWMSSWKKNFCASFIFNEFMKH